MQGFCLELRRSPFRSPIGVLEHADEEGSGQTQGGCRVDYDDALEGAALVNPRRAYGECVGVADVDQLDPLLFSKGELSWSWCVSGNESKTHGNLRNKTAPTFTTLPPWACRAASLPTTLRAGSQRR